MFHRHNGHRFMDKARDVMSDSRDFARTGANEATAFIHAQPVLSTLLGAGTGLLLGFVYGSFRKPAPESSKLPSARSGSKSRSKGRA